MKNGAGKDRQEVRLSGRIVWSSYGCVSVERVVQERSERSYGAVQKDARVVDGESYSDFRAHTSTSHTADVM